MPANLENSAAATGLEKSVFIPIPKKGNAKECSSYRTIALILHVSEVILKILQPRLQQYMNHELPDIPVGFTKGRGTRDQIANIHYIVEKATEFHKNIYFCLHIPQEAGQVVWYSHLLKNFPVCCDPHSQRLLYSQ